VSTQTATASALQPPRLVWTKLNAPVQRDHVPRTELLRLLVRGPHAKLVLVRAPAGWGKSALLADWHASPRETRAFAWVALDGADSDPLRFLLYLVEALRTLEPEVGTTSLPILLAPGVDLVEDALPVLLNELQALSGDAVLVLDDYHAITNELIHDVVAYLLEHIPLALTLAVATRSEPALPLARLRARGDLLEIDPDALRFSKDEARALLNDLHGLDLDDTVVARLHERTEGWVAGLFLAALSLRGRDDARAFVDTFAGDDRHIADYLCAEVLAGHRAEVREFLLRTSILERFCAPLCDAVTGSGGAARLLPEIERANFLLVPLDTRRDWYRYHHLFGELLRDQLTPAEPGLLPELHRRAAGWLLAEGFVSEAIQHTIAAGDHAEAGERIAGQWPITLLGSAGDAVIEGWLRALPESVVRADVRLCIARCYVELSRGRMDGVETWLAAAEAAPQPGPFRDGHVSAAGAVAGVRAAWLWQVGDVDGSLAAGREARRSEEGSPWEAIGVAVIGLAHVARGEWDEGRHWMGEYSRIGRESGHHLHECSGLSTVSACLAETGELDAAADAAERALEIAGRHGIDEHWCTAHAHLVRGLVRERAGDSAGAAAALVRSVELARRGAGPVSEAWPLVHLTRVMAAGGDRPGARKRLAEAREALAPARDPGIFAQRVEQAEQALAARARVLAPGEPLSDRELAVLRLLATECSQREIGERLYISLNTVKSHTKSIFRKLSVTSRADAVARARELALL